VGITVKALPITIILLWLVYIIGMALTNNICDCAKDFNGWWELEYWT